jgi:hypothetical protein
MKRIGRRALYLCLCFLACLSMDSFFPAREVEHDCPGENCPVCAQVEIARSSAENALSPSDNVFFRLFVELNIRRGVSGGNDDLRRPSLSELMVKLTC